MSDTRKIEEQTREELLKEHEVSMEDLEKVSGGTDQGESECQKCHNVYKGTICPWCYGPKSVPIPFPPQNP